MTPVGFTMGDKTNIGWTDATWNPIRGCSKVDADGMPYEGVVDDRGRWNGKLRQVPEHLADPLRWRRPQRIFVNSMSDLFHPDVPFEFVAAVFGVMAAAQRHTFQVLTKRPERAKEFFDWAAKETARQMDKSGAADCVQRAQHVHPDLYRRWHTTDRGWPLPNVWIGTSVGHAGALHRIDQLREVPAAVRFLSLEPLHGPLGELDLTGIGWVIVGGESGRDARPMHPDWVRSIRDQCVAAGVPFFFMEGS